MSFLDNIANFKAFTFANKNSNIGANINFLKQSDDIFSYNQDDKKAGKQADFSEQEVNDILDILNNISEEDLQAEVEQDE